MYMRMEWTYLHWRVWAKEVYIYVYTYKVNVSVGLWVDIGSVYVCICMGANVSVRSCAGPVGWGYRILWLHLCRGVRLPQYETKKFDGKVSVMLELCGMQRTPSLPSLSGLLWLRMVAPDMVLSMGHIELSRVMSLNWIVWN